MTGTDKGKEGILRSELSFIETLSDVEKIIYSV